MSDKPSKVLPPMPEANALAPFIYFDLVPNYGIYSGVVNFTLEAVQFTMDAEGHVSQARVTVAHVRTSLEGLGGASKGCYRGA